MHTTNVRSIVVSGAESASNAPPVPPRRKKRKAKPAAIAKSVEEETSPTRLRKPDRKRLAPLPPPPPPPPLPPRAIRRIKSHVARDQPQETSNVQTADDAEETFNSLSSIESSPPPPSLQSEDVETTEKNQDRNDRQSGPRRETNSPRGRPFVFETRNKYPPLFFTLHDFQNVMSNTLQQQRNDDDNNNNTNDEGCKPSAGLSDKCRGSFREFFEKPSLDDEEGNLCFRVTTTNLPFERCLDRTWTATFADRLIENVDEPSRFIFEDYIDRSSKVRRSAGPMCCDSFQEEAAIPRLTKVRFVIESPSSSTPDYELENDDEATCDSLQNIDPLADEEVEEVSWNRGSSVQLTEITDDMDCTDASRAFGQVQDIQEDPDEFGDVPFTTILRNSLDRWYSLENATNFIEAIDVSGQRGHVDSSDPQKQFPLRFEEGLKVEEEEEEEEELADASEADLKKEERCPPLAEISDQIVEDNKEYLDLSNGGCENENNNAKTEETAPDSKWELIRNKMNANFVQDHSTTCEKNVYPTSEINSEKSTIIDGTKVSDQQPIKSEVESNVLKGHLLSNRIETEASEVAVSPAEGGAEIGKQQAKISYSPDKSTGDYRRKLFVNESLRSVINRCDFTSNDLADESEDSDAQIDDDDDGVDDLNPGGIPTSEREIKRNDAKDDEIRVTANGRTSKPECFERRESIGASVNIRRSSFLENMLSEDSDQAWTSCKIVAVHRKSPPSSRETEEKTLADDVLNEPGKVDPEARKISEKSGRVVTTSVSPTAAEKMGRTAGEVKCDVLNELLSNFGNIRLKPVNRERRSAAESQPRATSPPRRKNDDEETELPSDSRKVSLNDHSGSCNLSVELKSVGTSLGARQWQHAASLTTRRIRNDLDKGNESREKCEEPSPTTNSSIQLPGDGGVLSNGNEESEKVDGASNTVNSVEGTESEDHSELSESSKNTSKVLAEPTKSDDVERLQMVAGRSEKTDARKEDVSRNRGAYARQLELSESLESSGDKSAIVRKIPRSHCNNNDNNRAVTPVAVSDDQSRNDTVTMITPGRVRSFVKYYEIRREATIDKDSKTSDRVDKDPVPGHQSVFSIRRGFEARSFEAGNRDSHRETTAEQDLERSSGSARFSTACIVHGEFVTRERSSRSANVEDDYVEVRKQMMHHLSPVSVSDSCHTTHGGRVKRKKSVQFQSGFTVIGAKSPGENCSAGIPAGQDKKRSPDRPTLNDSLLTENVDSRAGRSEDSLDRRSFEERNAAAQMQAAAKCEECSGEEVVTVPPASGGQDSWKVQRLSSLSVESPSSNRRKGCSRGHNQLQQPAGKRTRPAPALSCKATAKDVVGQYLEWPNKENTPGNAVNAAEGTAEGTAEAQLVADDRPDDMGSNLSRHNGKGLTGRRTQSSGNLCEPKGKLNSMGKILVPCSSAQRERYKFCGSLPNHLDDKDVLDDDPKENNNVMTDTIAGNLGGTLPHKKRSLGVHFSDGGPTGTLDLVKHRSQDSLDENDPWRYQQSDLDLVRFRHGNFDSVRRNRSAETTSDSSTRRYTRGTSMEDRCHRNSDLDLVGTLPKRKQDGRNGGKPSDTNSSSTTSQPCVPDPTENDLLMQIVHKPDCELVRHRQQLSKCIDLKLSKLAGGEPQDQGYASERSPEDEHPPSLPGQPFPNITPESTFRVTLQKSSRGLGLSVSGGGTAGPVRVKRLFPQQPAALSNKLQPGDILLAANGIPLTGLTNYEALEVLRTTPSTVELVVCRLPGDTSVTPPGAPPPPPARREPPPPLRILNPLPPLQIEPYGEFDIEMTKVGGSLGFTLRKADSSALGHYVRALVREPALSDGRIRPGDKIVAVDGAPLSPMSHEEAVQLLRQCGPTVRLRLYRDLAQTPVSALSPTEPDHPLRPPRTSLR
ncbi:uncharacterized protein LOC122533382 [Frieseomelitta varia]|uniref:uncharacterized protein LOC122533382 n=1 Tax=Frieseomelitta varia TaxID=561572 RepID=UPI001CB6B49B|nr:uncharacterized protein LOC122533382 [Frieseomelitta varia]